MHPGAGVVWKPLKKDAAAAAAGDGTEAADVVKLEVPLVRGAAMVRLKPTEAGA